MIRGMVRLRQLVAAASAGLALAVAPAAAQRRDMLTIGFSTFPPNFHPLAGNEIARFYLLGMVSRPLMTIDGQGNLVCLVCAEVPTFANGLAREIDMGDGRKGVALTFRLKADAAWGDGTPVTAKDVVFGHALRRRAVGGALEGELNRRILKIEARDDAAFVVHLDRVTFDYNDFSYYWLLPAHLEAKALAEPADYLKRSLYVTAPTERGLYNGPYRVAEYAPSSHVVLVPNEAWRGEQPQIRRIVVRGILNAASLEATLLAGGVDLVPGESGFPLDQVLALEARYPQRFRYLYRETLGYQHLDVNHDHPALRDRRVRQALMFGIDRTAITRAVFKDKLRVARSNVNSRQWMATADGPEYRHDPARARSLLDAAGWSTLRDGVRYNEKGDRLAFPIASVTGIRTIELMATLLAAQWREIGVDARPRLEAQRIFWGETLPRRKFEGLALFTWIDAPEEVPRQTLHSTRIPSAANGFNGLNYGGYRNPEMDSLIDRIEREIDRETRRPLWHRLQVLYAEDLPALPLFFSTSAWVLPLWLDGVVPSGHSATTTLGVERWRAR